MPRDTILFDINETILDLTSLRPKFKVAFGDESVTSTWFSMCDFNLSTQHLFSECKEEDVEDEASKADQLHRSTESLDVGLLATK